MLNDQHGENSLHFVVNFETYKGDFYNNTVAIQKTIDEDPRDEDNSALLVVVSLVLVSLVTEKKSEHHHLVSNSFPCFLNFKMMWDQSKSAARELTYYSATIETAEKRNQKCSKDLLQHMNPQFHLWSTEIEFKIRLTWK